MNRLRDCAESARRLGKSGPMKRVAEQVLISAKKSQEKMNATSMYIAISERKKETKHTAWYMRQEWYFYFLLTFKKERKGKSKHFFFVFVF